MEPEQHEAKSVLKPSIRTDSADREQTTSPESKKRVVIANKVVAGDIAAIVLFAL